jgi:hypothetical protein
MTRMRSQVRILYRPMDETPINLVGFAFRNPVAHVSGFARNIPNASLISGNGRTSRYNLRNEKCPRVIGVTGGVVRTFEESEQCPT